MKISLSLLFFLLFFPPFLHGEGWREIERGFSYQKIESPKAHLFLVNPATWRLDVLQANQYGQVALSSRRYRERSGALLVINGGFFDEKFGSLGLLIQGGKTVNPLRKASWGIFTLASGVPAIITPRDFRDTGFDMAIQAGPRLVVGGKTLSVRESVPARRSAIGVTVDNRILLAVCEVPILLKEWASLLQKEALHVLNLDGGGSTQISVKGGGLSLQVDGETGVPNVLAVFRK